MLGFTVAPAMVLALQPRLVRAQDPRAAAVDSIARAYHAGGGRLDAGTLVRLDQRLRALLPYWSWEGRPLAMGSDPNAWAEVGVERLLFDPEFARYTGRLLREAHALDPRSHRPFTLFATVFDEDGETGTTPPSPQAAEQYLSEFPDGPFDLQAHLALGHFASDLFQVLARLEAGDRETDKYQCYRGSITAAPLPVQRRQAQARAIEHYGALVRLRPDVPEFADWLAQARRGRFEGWHYCAD